MVLLLLIILACYTASNGVPLLTPAGSPELYEAVKQAGPLCMLPTVLARHKSSSQYRC
jgi:hypothetical protein